MNQYLPFLILVDCEPDTRETWPGNPELWRGFERLHDCLTEWRDIISQKTESPAHFSWFWRADPQIEDTYHDPSWPICTYAKQIEDSAHQGDAFGLHPHAWRWDPSIERWIADHGNPKWIDTCLRLSFSTFQNFFGAPCRLVRFGDGWLDNATVRLAEQLGAEIDLTLEPGHGAKPSLVKEEFATGCIPDRRRVPTCLYHPSHQDFRIVDNIGGSKLWMMPISTARRSMFNYGNYLSLVSNFAMPHTRTLALNFGFEPNLFQHLYAQVLARRPQYVTVCTRTDVGANSGLLRYANENLRWLVTLPLAKNLIFMTPTEAVQHLTAQRTLPVE